MCVRQKSKMAMRFLSCLSGWWCRYTVAVNKADSILVWPWCLSSLHNLNPDLTSLSQHQSLLVNDYLCPVSLHNVVLKILVSKGQNGIANEINIKLGAGINCKQLSIVRPGGGGAPGSFGILCLSVLSVISSSAILQNIYCNNCLAAENNLYRVLVCLSAPTKSSCK